MLWFVFELEDAAFWWAVGGEGHSSGQKADDGIVRDNLYITSNEAPCQCVGGERSMV